MYLYVLFFPLQGGPGGGADQQKKAEERREQVMDMKNSILSQVLSQEARARCNYFFSHQSLLLTYLQEGY